MKKYYFTISSILFLILVLSCSNEETKTKNQQVSRPTAPIQNGEVRIGTQVWMTKNLNVSRYRNGDLIPQVIDPAVWDGLTTGAWCYYENNTANGKIYGKLYNWYAVIDPRGLSPIGWHVPSDAEWTTLTNFLGGQSVAGGKMKATGTIQSNTGLWGSPNVGAINSCGFTGLPGGDRIASGGFFLNIGNAGFWWSSSEFNTTISWSRVLGYNSNAITRDFDTKKVGLSVRCIKD